MSQKYKHMNLDDRIGIQECLNKGMSFKAIAQRIGKDQTTVSKEVKKHLTVYTNSFTKTNECCSNGAYPGPKNGYPRFWWFEYGIKDVGAVLKSLEERNFIRWAPISNSVMRLTIPSLKEILEKYNLSVSGKKAELVERIISSISEEQLEALNLERKYELTDSGKVELAENQYTILASSFSSQMSISLSSTLAFS